MGDSLWKTVWMRAAAFDTSSTIYPTEYPRWTTNSFPIPQMKATVVLLSSPTRTTRRNSVSLPLVKHSNRSQRELKIVEYPMRRETGISSPFWFSLQVRVWTKLDQRCSCFQKCCTFIVDFLRGLGTCHITFGQTRAQCNSALTSGSARYRCWTTSYRIIHLFIVYLYFYVYIILSRSLAFLLTIWYRAWQILCNNRVLWNKCLALNKER